MATGWITVSPMDYPSFRVPFVFSVEFDIVARIEWGDPWGDIDVVSDQNCQARTETDDETLVAIAVVVIRKHLSNKSSAQNLNLADLILEGVG